MSGNKWYQQRKGRNCAGVCMFIFIIYTGELGYDRLNGTRKIGPSYAKSVVYI